MRQKYTLDLPVVLYDELRKRAEQQDCSIKDVIVRGLRFSLAAMEIEKDPNKDLIIRERVQATDPNGNSSIEYRDLVVTFM